MAITVFFYCFLLEDVCSEENVYHTVIEEFIYCINEGGFMTSSYEQINNEKDDSYDEAVKFLERVEKEVKAMREETSRTADMSAVNEAIERSKKLSEQERIQWIESEKERKKTLEELLLQYRKGMNLIYFSEWACENPEDLTKEVLGTPIIPHERGRAELALFLQKKLPREYGRGLEIEARYSRTFSFYQTEEFDSALEELRLVRTACDEYRAYVNEYCAHMKSVAEKFERQLRKLQIEKKRDEFNESMFEKELSREAKIACYQGEILIRQGKHEKGRERIKFFLQNLSREGYEPSYEIDARTTIAVSHLQCQEYASALEELRLAKKVYKTRRGYGGKPRADATSYARLCEFEKSILDEMRAKGLRIGFCRSILNSVQKFYNLVLRFKSA